MMTAEKANAVADFNWKIKYGVVSTWPCSHPYIQEMTRVSVTLFSMRGEHAQCQESCPCDSSVLMAGIFAYMSCCDPAELAHVLAAARK